VLVDDADFCCPPTWSSAVRQRGVSCPPTWSMSCPPSTRLPSETDMCDYWGISRTTVRQALLRLDQRGLIERRKGFGTFVHRTATGVWLMQSSEGFFQDEVDRLGRTVTSQILRAEAGKLPEWACEALGMPLGASGATLERLRSVDGDIALYVVNHVPKFAAEAALAMGDPNESLYRRLSQREGLDAGGGRRSVQAVAVDDRIAGHLQMEPGAPVALIESVTWDEKLRPFDCYRAWLRTDRIRIDVDVSVGVAKVPVGGQARSAASRSGGRSRAARRPAATSTRSFLAAQRGDHTDRNDLPEA
jgi:GntR family transcriptional regulator